MSCNKINDILKNDLCIGCGICTNFSKKSQMNISNDGFLIVNNYSHDSEEVSEEELVQNICPGKKSFTNNNTGDAIWGIVKSINLGYSNNSDIRFKGSSGGTITETLTFLLENKIIDYVIHIESDSIDPLANSIVITDDKNKILNNAGSKYCPSSPLENVISSLNKNKRYAFVGRPCDIVALSNYEKINRDITKMILYKIAFFCAGVPSIKGTYEIISKFGIEVSNLRSFRYRGNGWPGYTTAVDKDGNTFDMPYNDSWGKILNKHLSKRCKLCPDGIGMEADIVFGDGWDCDEKGYPIFEEGDGNSLIITRTEKGEELLKKLTENNRLIIKDFNINNLRLVQPYQFHRRANLKWRLNAMKLFNKEMPIYEKSVEFASHSASSKSKIKTFLGTLKRILNKRI